MNQFENQYEAILWAADNAVGPIVVFLRGWQHMVRLTPIAGKWYWDYGCYEEPVC